MNREWYQKTTWSGDDEADFFSRLNRISSRQDRVQYLRTQIFFLQNRADPPNFEASLQLIEQLLGEPQDRTQAALAWLQKARCLGFLERSEEGLNAYREAVALSKDASGSYATDAALHFALFIAVRGMLEHYNEALESLQGTEPILVLPLARYTACAAMALIADDTGMPDKAKYYAMKALEAIASHAIPPKDLDESISERLRQLAAR